MSWEAQVDGKKYSRVTHKQNLGFFPHGSDGKEPTCKEGDTGSIPGSGRSPGEGTGYHSSILSGEFHGQKSLAGYSPWSRKESDTTE